MAFAGLTLITSCAPCRTARPPQIATQRPETATPTPGPAIEISSDVWDFGTLERGESATSQIMIANRGTDSLRISLHTSCECLTPSIDSLVVAPGASAPVSLTYLGYEIKDASAKTIYIDSNDPATGRLAFTVRGKIVAGRGPHLVALPSPLLLERAARDGAALSVVNRGGEDLVVADIICFGCVSDWTERVLKQGEEATLRIQTLPDWTGGRWIEIRSNDPVWPIKRVSIVEID